MARLFNDLIINAAQREPDKTAVLHKEQGLSYGEVYEKSLQLADALTTAGLKKGDRVCFYLEKRFEKVISIFGIAIAGGIMVPVRRLERPHQVAHIVNNCGARVLITTEKRIVQLTDHFQKMPTLQTIISIDPDEDVSAFGTNVMRWQQIIAGHPANAPDIRISETDPVAILYTSGSTGRPKGVVLSHLNIVAGAEKVSSYLKLTGDDRLLSILTFGFDYGLNQLTSAFLKIAQIVLLDYLFPTDILRAVEKYRITGLAAVSSTWIQLLQKSWENTSMYKLRYITNTGGSIPAEYVAKLCRRLPDTEIFLMYGLTEAFRSTFLDPSLVENHPTSIGRAILGEEIMVLDKNDRPVKAGEIGELVHRGALVCQGYWGDPGKTAARFRENPLQDPDLPLPEMVVYSGDYVRTDDMGLLYFIGRKDEMIKCAGNRISPMEVEEILYRNDEISDTVVFGLPDEIYGQSVMAVVSVTADAEVDVKGLKNYCRETMPPYMVPKEIEIRDTLPRNANGKLDRSAIKKEIYAKLDIKN